MWTVEEVVLKILRDYKIQYKYSKNKFPMFYSDNSSFLIVLKSFNYRKATIKKTIKTQTQIDIILQNMLPQKIQIRRTSGPDKEEDYSHKRHSQDSYRIRGNRNNRREQEANI